MWEKRFMEITSPHSNHLSTGGFCLSKPVMKKFTGSVRVGFVFHSYKIRIRKRADP